MVRTMAKRHPPTVEAGDVILAGNLVDRAVRWLEAAGARRVVRGN